MSTELVSRIKQWTSEYEDFGYGYHSFQATAYRREATLYHRHGGKE